MATVINPFNPSTTPSGQFTIGLVNGGWLFVHNESPVILQFQAGINAGPVLVTAYAARCFSVAIGTATVTYKTLAQVQDPTQAPISQVYVEGYDPNEWTGGELFTALSRQVNVGNSLPLSTTANNLVNDGNAPGTQIIEATDTSGVGSDLVITNSGAITTHGLITVTNVGQPNGDVLKLVNSNDNTYNTTLGLGDAASIFGAGLWAFDVKNNGTVFSLLDKNGMSLNGRIKSLAGQTTAGNYGVPVIVAQAIDVNVTATTQQTILTYAVTTTGLYRIGGHFSHGNTGPTAVTFQVQYTDPHLGSPTITFCDSNAVAGIFARSYAQNTTVSTFPMMMQCKTGTNVTVFYTDASGTPSDFVSVIIERLA